MPYGTPSGPAGHEYTLTFRSVATVEGYPVTFQVAVTTEYLDNAAVGDVVQAFADLVHASPDFNLAFGMRTTAYTETLTSGVA